MTNQRTIARRIPATFMLLAGLTLSAACGSPLEDESVAEDPIAVDASPIVHGAPSRGKDPSVVALLIGDTGLCSGTLIAPDLVLTARHCVSTTLDSIACPSRTRHVQGDRDPKTIRVLAGESLASGQVVARGVATVTVPSTNLCGNDVAVLVLDRSVSTVKPSPIAPAAPLVGARARAVGFGIGEQGVGAGEKRAREHVPLVAVGAREFEVGEATCSGDSGGPALDESSGAVWGVVSRGSRPCDARDARNTYTRIDAHGDLLARAVAHPQRSSRAGLLAPSSSSVAATDMGSACTKAVDCTTGVCMHDAGGSYCSRSCGTGDRCPRGYRCRATTAGSDARACQRSP
jgi:secreted trypsin-like serine protease